MGSTQAEENMTLFKSDGRFFDQKRDVLFQCCTSYKGACEQQPWRFYSIAYWGCKLCPEARKNDRKNTQHKTLVV